MNKQPLDYSSHSLLFKTALTPSPGRFIAIRGARQHNLKNISLDLPRNKLIVITGVSGSGKSSLAFDTIYAEGQRRFVESLSAYARQFLERMNKPDVDLITGIPPAIALQQKTIARNPRSTVATITEIYDYIRLLWGRIGETICYASGKVVRKDTPQSALQDICASTQPGDRLYVLFPLQHTHTSLHESLEQVKQRGFFRIVVGDATTILDLTTDTPLDIASHDSIFVLVDRIVFRAEADTQTRLLDSLEQAFFHGNGRCYVRNLSAHAELRFSSLYECPTSGIAYDEPHPRLFSFNNPLGACPTCEGFGRTIGIDEDLVVPDKYKSLAQGAIAPFQTPAYSSYQESLLRESRERGIDVDSPIVALQHDAWDFVWNGGGTYPGVRGFFSMLEENYHKVHYRVLMSRYRGYTRCPDCGGSRLKLSARQVFVGGKNIPTVIQMTLQEALEFFATIPICESQRTVAERIIQEITVRLELLNHMGLGYLTLDRLAHTLSGGEVQRINLATSIGSSLVGALYVLDEPSIGLHPRDTDRMIAVLERLRNLGNTVLVVEHDQDIMRRADMLVDMGPRAGEHGGAVVFQGSPHDILHHPNSLTGQYLSGAMHIPVPRHRNTGHGTALLIKGAREHNLKNIDVRIPLGMMVAVTGVSGSGKSTLVHDVLYNGLLQKLGAPVQSVGKHDDIVGVEHLQHVEMVDQSPIGKSPRSTPATYTKAFDAIRELYASTQAAKQLGWKPGAFSFNIPGGRCETCQGEGMVKIEMQFLADLYLECEECRGTRYKKEVHHIQWHGKSIVDVLSMTIDEAAEFFAGEERITARLSALQKVGLGYMRMGQPATMLSGGEAQRIKLAAHLYDKGTASTLFIFDEPTTGLHFDDIAKLIVCFQELVARGHSLVIVEHNTDVMKCADWIIDLGPEAGDNGGRIVAEGTPESVASVQASHTGRFLQKILLQRS
ncbi:MAG: excinuclease ABC subunit UvrA [Bacteroidota bacterium]|nr:excinuclease ABC subunit UvrA [Candidatus Kapabacteria bacterium]MDW8219087.1 excinuclease ABC subunit UvrA [Bacteroidota bacterium]